MVAVEVDERLAALLPETVATYAPDHVDRLEVVAADALRITALPGAAPTALVANLPYNVVRAGPAAPAGAAAVARARTGDGAVRGRRPAGRLAGEQGLRHPVGQGGLVRRRTPRRRDRPARLLAAPNVDSGLVAWTRRDPPATTATREQVFAVVDAAFAQRRKTLRAALRAMAGSTQASQAALVAAGVDPEARGEVLDIDAFVRDRGGVGRGGHRMTHDAGVTVRVPAKVNLHLGVGAPRPDGFHPLDTVYQAVGLYDDVTARAGRWLVGRRCGRPVTSRRPALPAAGDNIVDRAARLLADLHGVERARRGRGRQGHPGRRRHGRRLRRRGRRAGRPRPALGRRHLRRRPAAPGGRARQRRAVRTRRGQRPRHRPRRGGASRGRRGVLVVGGGSRAEKGCRPRRSTGASTSSTPTLLPRPQVRSQC